MLTCFTPRAEYHQDSGEGTRGMRSGGPVDLELRLGPSVEPVEVLTSATWRAGLDWPLAALVVEPDRVAVTAPLVHGTGLEVVARLTETDDVAHAARRSVAAGAGEIEVRWHDLEATVDAIGVETAIACDLSLVPAADRRAFARFALDRGARHLRCAATDFAFLEDLAFALPDQRIKLDVAVGDLPAADLGRFPGLAVPLRLSVDVG